MKIFAGKDKKLYTICAVILAAVIVISVLSLVFWRHDVVPTKGVTFYGFNDVISLENYLPMQEACEMLKNHDGIAVQCDSGIVFANGDFHDIGKTVCTYNNGLFAINCEAINEKCGEILPEGTKIASDIASLTGKDLKIYEDKLLVYMSNAEDINVFDNYYTFEMISLKLRNAPQEDFINAFITLPYEISNGSTIIQKFTDPDLDLGLQTSLYGEKGAGVNCLEKPVIVAGEGNNKNNHTIVRVYNEFSAKVAQFLAFPGNVTGGVKISAISVIYNETERGLIATASCNGKFYEARSVRVFDEYGSLYMEVVPGFAKSAPYNILTGHFIDKDCAQLLIMPVKFDENGSLPYEIYSLSDGSLIDEGKFEENVEIKNKKSTISLYDEEYQDSVLLYVNSEYSYKVDFENGNAKLTPICQNNDIHTNGIYQSAFSDVSYIATENMMPDEEGEIIHRSYVKMYKDEDFEQLDVGHMENVFYFNGSHDKIDVEETEYYKKAEFKHIRSDINSTIICRISKPEDVLKLAEAKYSDWKMFSTAEISRYNRGYNVWEPCFTHRLICNDNIEILANYKDQNGNYKFATIDNEGNRAEYYELGGKFYVGTYAEGLIEMDKMRIYPLRNVLDLLHYKFVEHPELMVALEPIHEIEINSGEESVGDYNAYMVEGFRSYLISRYETIENINKKFGTDFKIREDIQAPTNTDSSKAWDKYEGEYFNEWTLYTRQIVNKRLAESFREALLAGFPSEIINGHSIPEGDAISGFLGQANTRISPIDAMMTLGCGFGATRYGYWAETNANFLKNAFSAGFRNISLGEYNSLQEDESLSVEQIYYLWSHGAKFVNLMSNVHSVGYYYDLLSIKELAEENKPRLGQTNGTKMSVPYVSGSKRYQIVEIGGDGETPGLIKSIDEEGNWTGDVYLTPFHSSISVESFSLSTNARSGAITPTISNLNTGDMLEINFIGGYKGKSGATLHIDVYEDGNLSNKYSAEFVLDNQTKNYKYVLSNQVVLGKIKIKIYFECDNYSDVVSNSLCMNVMRESVARVFFGDTTANYTRGGTYFDVFKRHD